MSVEKKLVEAEMATEMSAKERRSAFKVLSATRKGKLGHCTRKMNEIKAMMDAGDGYENVHQYVAGFKMYHETVQTLLTEDVREENLNWYEPKMSNYNAFMGVGKWLKSGRPEPDPLTLVNPTDSVSVAKVSV